MTVDKGKEHQKSDQGKIHLEMKELRKNPRKSLVKFTYFAPQTKYYKGLIKNINRGGAFIETKAKLSPGQKIKLVIPGARKYILIRGEIIHINPIGFGIKFERILKIEKSLETIGY